MRIVTTICAAAVVVLSQLGTGWATTVHLASGTLVDAAGNGLNGSAYFYPVNPPGGAAQVGSITNGHFTVPVAAGDYQPVFNLANQPGEISITPPVTTITTDHTFAITVPLHSLTIRAVDDTGATIGNVNFGYIQSTGSLGPTNPDVNFSENLRPPTTSDDGTADLTYLPLDNDLTIETLAPPGTQYVNTTLTIPAHSTGTLTVTLPTADLSASGTLVDAAGNGLNGSAYFYSVNPPGGAAQVGSITNGHFTVPVAAGDYQPVFNLANQPGEISITPPVTTITTDHTFAITVPLHSLTIRAVDDTGATIGNVNFGYIQSTGSLGPTNPDVNFSENLRPPTTSDDGTADLTYLPLDNDLTIETLAPPGTQYVNTTLTIPAHSTGTLTVTLPTADLSASGTLVDAAGNGLNGSAYFYPVNPPGGAAQVGSITNGHFTVPVAAGDYQPVFNLANQPGEISITPPVTTITTDHTFAITVPLHSLTIRAVDDTGATIGNVNFGYIQSTGSLGPTNPDVNFSENLRPPTTSDDGTADLTYLPLDNDLTIETLAPPGTQYVNTTLTIPAHSTGTLTVTLASFEGDVSDSGGEPLPDQQVTVKYPGTSAEAASTTTDAEGSFGVTTDPGVYDVTLEGDVGDPTHYVVKAPKVDLRTPKGDQHLVLPTQNVNLHIVDTRGAAVPSASIAMACTSTSFPLLGKTAKGTQCATETADANGNAVLTVLPTATIKLNVKPPAGSFVTATTVQLSPTNGVSKTITLASLPKPTLSVAPSAAGPYVTGQKITYTVTATPPSSGATPSGSVTVAVDGTNVATKTLRTGATTVPVTLSGAGTHTITARYSGSSPTYAPASTTTTVKVGKAATTTALTINPTAPTYGRPVTVTATVTPTAPATGTPTGQARFTVDGVTQPTATLTTGRATFTLTGLSIGNHDIAVTYQGSDDHTRSTATTTITVAQAATRTTITSNHPTSTAGQKVTFRITVASTNAPAGTPTGTAVVTIDGIDQPPVTLTDGTASVSTSSLTVGTHQVTARYTGDAVHATSTSSPITQTVSGSP